MAELRTYTPWIAASDTCGDAHFLALHAAEVCEVRVYTDGAKATLHAFLRREGEHPFGGREYVAEYPLALYCRIALRAIAALAEVPLLWDGARSTCGANP